MILPQNYIVVEKLFFPTQKRPIKFQRVTYCFLTIKKLKYYIYIFWHISVNGKDLQDREHNIFLLSGQVKYMWFWGCLCGTSVLNMIPLRNSDCLSDNSTQPLYTPIPYSDRARPCTAPSILSFSPSALSPLRTLFQSHWAKNRPCCNELTVLGVATHRLSKLPDCTHTLHPHAYRQFDYWECLD